MDITQYEQVIKGAIQNEIDARIFYEEIAKNIKSELLKEVFTDFAKEEGKHEQILTQILNQQTITASHFDCDRDYKVAQTVDLPEVSPDMDLKNAIALAMKNEEIAMKRYTALADNCEDAELRAVFLDLASMERGHKFKMEQSFVDVAYPEVW